MKSYESSEGYALVAPKFRAFLMKSTRILQPFLFVMLHKAIYKFTTLLTFHYFFWKILDCKSYRNPEGQVFWLNWGFRISTSNQSSSPTFEITMHSQILFIKNFAFKAKKCFHWLFFHRLTCQKNAKSNSIKKADIIHFRWKLEGLIRSLQKL